MVEEVESLRPSFPFYPSRVQYSAGRWAGLLNPQAIQTKESECRRRSQPYGALTTELKKMITKESLPIPRPPPISSYELPDPDLVKLEYKMRLAMKTEHHLEEGRVLVKSILAEESARAEELRGRFGEPCLDPTERDSRVIAPHLTLTPPLRAGLIGLALRSAHPPDELKFPVCQLLLSLTLRQKRKRTRRPRRQRQNPKPPRRLTNCGGIF
jgi:hypothetical protein